MEPTTMDTTTMDTTKPQKKSLQVPPKRPHLTRLSSMTSTKDDVSDGGTDVVVVPHRYMLKRSQSFSSGFAASLGKARKEVGSMDIEDEATVLPTSPESPGSPEMFGATPEESAPATPITPITPLDGLPSADTFAFAFDIDGVLVRGGQAIPEAIEAMKMLNGENKYGVKVPYIFLTNGGGKTEAERCLDLSRQLDISISPAQFICGHSPMRELTEAYGTVLVVGGEGEKCRQVAEGYGFKDVITPGDIIKHDSATTPFRKLTAEELRCSKSGRDLSKVKIEAIFVFADSRDWAGDCQIMLDLAMSKGGYLGTLSETFDEGPPIFFSHSDMVWSAAHANVRLGMGALRRMLETLFRDVTKGKELDTIAFGKPQIPTFEFATRLLRQWRKDEHEIDAPPETVYFIGDTPESDIRGTNEFNKHSENDWFSVLVKTGVWQEGTEPAYKPRATVDNVLEAVKFGLDREFGEKGTKVPTKNIIEPLCLADTGEVPSGAIPTAALR